MSGTYERSTKAVLRAIGQGVRPRIVHGVAPALVVVEWTDPDLNRRMQAMLPGYLFKRLMGQLPKPMSKLVTRSV